MTVSGILNIDKPKDWTSFDVVRAVRRGTGVKRVGHAGTLDPAATGVLPLLLGQATRLTEYLIIDTTKEYVAEVTLGVETDTYDADGEAIERKDASGVSEAEAREALAGFVGEILQTPPAYSAIKRDGVPLYKRARRGEAVTPEPRSVVVESLEVEAYEAPLLRVRVVCGKGFYVRSLAHDLGAVLGVGGHLSGLVRTRTGPFRLDEAVSLDALRSGFEDGTWAEHLAAPDEVLLTWPAAILGGEGLQDLLHGRETALQELAPHDGRCRAYSDAGEFVGILEQRGAGVWRPGKVFATSEG